MTPVASFNRHGIMHKNQFFVTVSKTESKFWYYDGLLSTLFSEEFPKKKKKTMQLQVIGVE